MVNKYKTIFLIKPGRLFFRTFWIFLAHIGFFKLKPSGAFWPTLDFQA